VHDIAVLGCLIERPGHCLGGRDTSARIAVGPWRSLALERHCAGALAATFRPRGCGAPGATNATQESSDEQ